MANPAAALLPICVVAAAIVAVAVAVAVGDDMICNVKGSELIKCLPAIEGNPPPKPSASCCAVMCKADLRCLCNYKSRLAELGLNPGNALALPGKCGRKLPPKCNDKKHLHLH